jgi:hypothetical protein
MKNLHNTITSLLFVGVLISLVSSCGNQKSSKNETSNTEIENVSKSKKSDKYIISLKNVEYCSTCGALISGGSTVSFGRKYCHEILCR